jgi:hypothetical protein
MLPAALCTIAVLLAPLAQSASVSVSPNLIKDNEYVHISVSSESPGADDWVGAYRAGAVLGDKGVPKEFPLKMVWCRADAAYLQSGNAKLRMLLTAAYRTAVDFIMFSGGTATPVFIAAAPQGVRFDPAALMAPMLPRVMPTGDAAAPLRIVWSSMQGTVQPALQWGPGLAELVHTVPATTAHLLRSELCGAPANAEGWFEQVRDKGGGGGGVRGITGDASQLGGMIVVGGVYVLPPLLPVLSFFCRAQSSPRRSLALLPRVAMTAKTSTFESATSPLGSGVQHTACASRHGQEGETMGGRRVWCMGVAGGLGCEAARGS